MDRAARTRLSKFLSFVLRHRPGAIGLELDEHGWVEVDTLLARCRTRGRTIVRSELDEVVARCAKQRFAVSDDGARIRASQGHSVPVDLDYQPAEPPETLFHGTVAASLDAIHAGGLQRMKRHHVHLSADAETAVNVGARRGSAIVLRVRAGAMSSDGYVFFVSANGVWLTEHVPVEYLEFPV